ncbi:glycosyl hydrolase family 28-related protein [Nocardioides dilutus]
MADVIKLRRGTAAQWAAADPVLAAGEPGFETDTGLHKIGNGGSPWSTLPYFLHEPALETWYGEHPPSITPGGLVINVKDSRFGATGDGSTDDTAAIRQALDEADDGGVVFFPPGTYLVASATSSILTGRAGVTLAGAGPTASVITVAPTSAATRVLDLSRASDSGVRDLGFEASGNTAVLSAVYASALRGQQNIWVRGCRFADFMPGNTITTFAAVYTWTSDGVHVLDSEFTGCGRAVTVDQPEGPCEVSGNRVTADGATTMATGIYVRRSSGVSTGHVVVSGNTVSGALHDPGGVGAEGHGIAVFRCQDVRVIDNHSQGNGRGVLVSNQAFGALVQGNTCVDNHDAGIRCEPEITATDTSVGANGANRGVTVIGNVCRANHAIGTPSGANSGKGITLSYAAGSTVAGNVVRDNSGDGIHCDSDRVSIVGNVVSNNWTGYTIDPNHGRRGGIRIYAGSGCNVVANQCFDNQSTKTQQYGLSLSGPGGGHRVHGNTFAGNAAGEVFGAERIVDGFFGATPVTRRPDPGTANALNTPTVLNNLVQSLRELGLIT